MSDQRGKLSLDELIALGESVADVAHEIRGFLTPIVAGADYLSRHQDAEVAAAARRILKQAGLCHAYANSLLSHPSSTAVAKEVLSLGPWLQELIAEREGRATITLTLDDSGPFDVSVNPLGLMSVFENLWRNAEEAQPDREPSIEVQVSRTKDRISITVLDDGPGIPSDMKDRLFQRYATSGKTSGSGIGLHLCRRLIQEWDGEMSHLDNEEGGAQFQIVLPAASSGAAEGTGGPAESARPLNILCIDDDQNTLDTYDMILKLDGHRTTCALSGQEGLNQMKKMSFDVILCDLRLPDLGGMAFYQEMEKITPGSRRRLIYATGDLMNEDSRRFLETTRCPFLIKPFEIEELRVAIRVALQNADQ